MSCAEDCHSGISPATMASGDISPEGSGASMFEFLTDLFDTSDFPARWHCGSWTAAQGWLHILSDLGIWSAYLAIPCVLVYFALRRRDLPFKFIFLLFGAFILACGTTHLMEAVIFWWPAYRLAGVLKLFTALVSWATVFALIHIAPKAFALRSPQELEREAIARKQVEELANAMPQMVWTARPDGYLDYYNDRWYEYTGLPREVGGDDSWKSILHPDDLQKCLDIWYAAVHSGNQLRDRVPPEGAENGPLPLAPGPRLAGQGRRGNDRALDRHLHGHRGPETG